MEVPCLMPLLLGRVDPARNGSGTQLQSDDKVHQEPSSEPGRTGSNNSLALAP